MSKKNEWTTVLVAAAMLGLAAGQARAGKYEEVELKEGGTIVGVVNFEGEPPKRRKLQVTTDIEPCGRKPILNDDLVVSEDLKVRWVLASIEKISSGKPFAAEDPENPVQLDQIGCRFRPHVVIVPEDRTLQILNRDGILHNVHIWATKNDTFNRAMPGRVTSMDVSFDREERIRVSCDVHKWMGAWIVVAEHPYYAVTGEDGTFRLENVPAGTHTVKIWHEKLGKQEKEVTVRPGQETRVEFALKQ
ncbi:MAG: carboxypeptidase regulatory-like domain-containing protein [Phycisphaerae bacterium]